MKQPTPFTARGWAEVMCNAAVKPHRPWKHATLEDLEQWNQDYCDALETLAAEGYDYPPSPAHMWWFTKAQMIETGKRLWRQHPHMGLIHGVPFIWSAGRVTTATEFYPGIRITIDDRMHLFPAPMKYRTLYGRQPRMLRDRWPEREELEAYVSNHAATILRLSRVYA